MTIDTLGIVGAGAMGSGIIEVAAKSGVAVVARDINPEAVEAGRVRVEGSLAKAVERNKLDEAGRDAALAAITWTTDIADMGACQMVIEAAPEILELKLAIFRELDAVLPEGAVMATNTSSIPIIDIAMATNRPESVCWHPLLQSRHGHAVGRGDRDPTHGARRARRGVDLRERRPGQAGGASARTAPDSS